MRCSYWMYHELVLICILQLRYRDRFNFLLDFCCIIFFAIRQFRRMLLSAKYCEMIRLLKFCTRLPNIRTSALHMEYSYFYGMPSFHAFLGYPEFSQSLTIFFSSFISHGCFSLDSAFQRSLSAIILYGLLNSERSGSSFPGFYLIYTYLYKHIFLTVSFTVRRITFYLI